jgi:hypothetical protein
MMDPKVSDWLVSFGNMHLNYEYYRRYPSRAFEKSFGEFAKNRPQAFYCGPTFRQHAKNDGNVRVRELLALVVERIFDGLR